MAATADSLDAPEVDSVITLKANDGFNKYSVLKSHARISVLLRVSMESDPAATELNLNVAPEVLGLICDYMTMHAGTEAVPIQKPLRDKDLTKVCKDPRDAEWINNVWQYRTRAFFYDLLKAANYMDIKGLLNLCCAKVGSVAKGEPVEKIPDLLKPATA